nr:MAG TPA: protein of unknown function (DUF4406) [Caudoviricetes sp.]
MKIYLSGQISGTELSYTRKRFGDVADTLRALGHEVTNPLCNGLSEADPWEEHIAKDIINLIDCEGIYMLQGWEDSQGARIEHAVAKELGKVVFYE